MDQSHKVRRHQAAVIWNALRRFYNASFGERCHLDACRTGGDRCHLVPARLSSPLFAKPARVFSRVKKAFPLSYNRPESCRKRGPRVKAAPNRLPSIV
jgi:hypothetical protein